MNDQHEPTPDEPTADQPVPDEPTPDETTADQPTPDQPTPDRTDRGTGPSHTAAPDAGDAVVDAEADELPADLDAAVDAELAAAGARLRSEATAVDGHDLIVTDLRHRVQRTRRTSWIAVGVAAALVAATVGFTLSDSEPAEFASGRGGVTPDAGSPEAIVAALPDEPVDPHDVELVASVSRFDSCDALIEELRTVGAAHVGSRGFGDLVAGGLIVNAVGGSGGDGPALAEAGDHGGGTIGTNTIVEGVDEPDQVKASGSLVVEIAGGSLRVVDTTVPAVVGTLELAQRDDDDGSFSMPESLVLEGDRAVVFGSESEPAEALEGDPSASRPDRTFLTVTFVDLADPAAPRVTDRVRIEGRLVAVRRVGGKVRMVTSSSLQDLPMVLPTTASSVRPALEQNRLAVAASGEQDWIPAWDRGAQAEARPLMGCDDVVVPDTFAGVQMTSLVEFSLEERFDPAAVGILAPSVDITATADDVVVASNVWVDPAAQTDDFDDWSTALHRFAFDDGGPRYVASGEVPGSIRDDFSLAMVDDGLVGAVTVDVLPWDQRDEAKVTVRMLGSDEDAATMTEIGELVVEDSGFGAAGMRFIGDRLVVSSGLVGQELSVVDLSDPTAPAQLGTVTLAGTGSYVHPVDADRILVVGPKLDGASPADVHASLIDLTDAPVEVARWVLPDAYSQVGNDHHAFTWWPDRSTAAFGVAYNSADRGVFPPSPDAVLLGIGAGSITPSTVGPLEADLGPRCPLDQEDRTGCDDSGPPLVLRVLVVDGEPWLYTSESLEHLDPVTMASLAVVPLPPAAF